jgi:transposase
LKLWKILKKELPEIIYNAEIQANQQGKSLRIMFQDEARFGRITDPKRCWSPKGFRPIVQKQFVREYTYLFGAFSPLDGVNDLIILPEVSFKAMNIFLEILSNRHPDDLILLFCDQASFHRNKELSIPKNIIIRHIPPYSPELNPSENMWGEMREKYFGNYAFKSLKAVEDRLVETSIFYENNPKIVQSITGFDWIVNTLLNVN